MTDKQKVELLAQALIELLSRIRSEPDMSGHLKNIYISPGLKTSDAIRFADEALREVSK